MNLLSVFELCTNNCDAWYSDDYNEDFNTDNDKLQVKFEFEYFLINRLLELLSLVKIFNIRIVC